MNSVQTQFMVIQARFSHLYERSINGQQSETVSQIFTPDRERILMDVALRALEASQSQDHPLAGDFKFLHCLLEDLSIRVTRQDLQREVKGCVECVKSVKAAIDAIFSKIFAQPSSESPPDNSVNEYEEVQEEYNDFVISLAELTVSEELPNTIGLMIDCMCDILRWRYSIDLYKKFCRYDPEIWQSARLMRLLLLHAIKSGRSLQAVGCIQDTEANLALFNKIKEGIGSITPGKVVMFVYDNEKLPLEMSQCLIDLNTLVAKSEINQQQFLGLVNIMSKMIKEWEAMHTAIIKYQIHSTEFIHEIWFPPLKAWLIMILAHSCPHDLKTLLELIKTLKNEQLRNTTLRNFARIYKEQKNNPYSAAYILLHISDEAEKVQALRCMLSNHNYNTFPYEEFFKLFDHIQDIKDENVRGILLHEFMKVLKAEYCENSILKHAIHRTNIANPALRDILLICYAETVLEEYPYSALEAVKQIAKDLPGKQRLMAKIIRMHGECHFDLALMSEENMANSHTSLKEPEEFDYYS